MNLNYLNDTILEVKNVFKSVIIEESLKDKSILKIKRSRKHFHG